MKKIQLLLIVFIIISCSGKKEDTTERTIHNIEFLNWQLPMPKKYARITFDQYQIIIKESYDDSTYVAMRINQIEKSKNMFGNYAMFCDTTDIRNTVTILEMGNPKPNDYLGRTLSKKIHADSRKKGKLENFVYKPLNNRLIQGWIFKIKGERYYQEEDFYMYQTTYMAKDFGAFAIHVDKEIDFEKEFTKR